MHPNKYICLIQYFEPNKMKTIILLTPFTSTESENWRLSNETKCPLYLYNLASISYRIDSINAVSPAFDLDKSILDDRCYISIAGEDILIAEPYNVVLNKVFGSKVDKKNLSLFLTEHKN